MVEAVAAGKREMLKLAERMTENFCGGVSASPARGWRKLRAENLDEDVRVTIRRVMVEPGEPSSAVLCAAASVWLAVPPQPLFDLLLRSEWRILSDGGPVQEAATIATGHRRGNAVSLLRARVSRLHIQLRFLSARWSRHHHHCSFPSARTQDERVLEREREEAEGIGFKTSPTMPY